MMKIIIPAIAFLALTSCGRGSSELQNALNDLQSVKNNIENIDVDEVIETVTQSENSYVSADGNYSIDFIGTPTETNESVPTEVGNIEITMAIYEKSATEVYMATYNDYPSVMISESDPKSLLEDALDGSTNSLKIDVVDEKSEEDFDGYPSIFFKGHASSSNFHAVYRIILRENRLYQIGALRDGSYITSEMEESFFGSLKFED